MSKLETVVSMHHANSHRYHAAAAAFHQSLVDHGSGSPQWTAAKEAYAKSGEALRASFEVVMGLQGKLQRLEDEEARVRREEETTMDAALEERVKALGEAISADWNGGARAEARRELQALGMPFERARWRAIVAAGHCQHGTAAWEDDICGEADCEACRLEYHGFYGDSRDSGCECACCEMVPFFKAGYELGRDPSLYEDEESVRFSEELQRRIDARKGKEDCDGGHDENKDC